MSQTDSQNEVESEGRTNSKTDSQTDSKTDSKTDSNNEVESEGRTDSKIDSHNEEENIDDELSFEEEEDVFIEEEDENELQAMIVPINEKYEWFQYNKQLRLIHSIDDDMFQAQSIINACNSTKKTKHWMENKGTKGILAELEARKSEVGIPTPGKIMEKRTNIQIDLRGLYINRFLVNIIAQWCSPMYSIYIAKLLDDIFAKEREEMKKEIELQQIELHKQQNQINQLQEQVKTTTSNYKQRSVPKNYDRHYIFLLTYEDEDWKSKKANDIVELKSHRLNKKSFYKIKREIPDYKRFYIQTYLPISMTVNEDLQRYLKERIPTFTHYGKLIYSVPKKDIDKLRTHVINYFKTFQNP